MKPPNPTLAPQVRDIAEVPSTQETLRAAMLGQPDHECSICMRPILPDQRATDLNGARVHWACAHLD